MIIEKIDADLIESMRNRNQIRLGTLRLLRSEIKNLEIELRASGKTLTDEDVSKVIQKEAKKRKESIEIYTNSGRQDLVTEETKELEVIQEYLPEQLNEEDLKTEIKSIIDKLDTKDFGNAMKTAMQELKGKADGAVVSKLVKEILSP